MTRKKYPPTDDTADLTRQVEMLAQGIAMNDVSQNETAQETKPKRRTLDDMRRLSQHIKGVPIYKRK